MIAPPKEESAIPIIHFYRALVDHTDMARQRLDTTTNWAVVTTVGVISFAFNSPSTPHFILLMLLVANTFFLLMEARRYQLYDVWQTRLDVLHRYYFAPSFTGYRYLHERQASAKLRDLGENLGETRPRMSTIDAMGFRIRRHYMYIFAVTLGAWLLKLYIHPMSPVIVAEFIERASVGLISGHAILLAIAVYSAVAALLALRAPSEYLVNWAEQPSPLKRILAFRWFYDPTAGETTKVYPDHGRLDERASSSDGVGI